MEKYSEGRWQDLLQFKRPVIVGSKSMGETREAEALVAERVGYAADDVHGARGYV